MLRPLLTASTASVGQRQRASAWALRLTALPLAFFLAGCGTSDRDVFKRAEDHHQRKEYAEALKYYRLLSDEHPDSEWADRALERQATILAEHLDKPEEAVRAYQRLVSQFPDSEFAPAAHLKMGELCYHRLHRYEEAAAAYNRALGEYGEDPEFAAQVLLAIGKMDCEEGKWQGVQHLNAVLRDYPMQKPRCAAAQFFIARAHENVKRDASRAVEEYQKVIDKYPETKWADEAKKAIGWIYYYTDRAEREEEPQKVAVPVRRTAVSPKESFTAPSFITSVGDCLRSLGVEASPSYLMGISGLAFQMYYDRSDRVGGADHLPLNPLSAICKALGLEAVQRQATSFQDGLESMKKALDTQQPAFVPMVLPPPSWVTIAGYDEAEKTVVAVGSDGVTRSIPWGQLAKAWSTESCPSLDPTDGRGARYTWYAFRKRGTPQSPARTAELAVLAGTRIMKDRSSGRFAAGFRAYEELIDDLRTERDYAAADIDDREQLIRWATSCLPRLASARASAAAFLRNTADQLPAGKRASAVAAAGSFDQAVKGLRQVSLAAPRSTSVTTETAAPAEDSFLRDCREAASTLQQVVAAERAALANMEKVCQ